MSARAAGALLFTAAVVCVPFPMFGLEGSFVPVARYLQLAAVSFALMLREGPAGMVGTFTLLLAVHAAVYALALLTATWLAVRFGLARLSPRPRAAVAFALVAALVGVTATARVYDTQFHHSSAHARLFELYR